MRLANKIALVTGGTTGIGLATAHLFHAEGARVFVTGRDPATLAAARDRLRGVAEVIASDAGDVASIDRLFAQLRAEVDRLDVLFLNAGVLHEAALAELDERAFDRVFDVNVKGPLFAIRAAAPMMPAGSSIVINGSIVAHMGSATGYLYSASKAAVRSLARSATADLAPRGIRVNVLSPGPTDTGIIAKSGRDEAATKQWLAGKIPLGRMGTPDELARAALFLASAESAFMTGEEMVVDGGMTRV